MTASTSAQTEMTAKFMRGGCNHQRPVKRGRRFSRNAVTPSRKSLARVTCGDDVVGRRRAEAPPAGDAAERLPSWRGSSAARWRRSTGARSRTAASSIGRLRDAVHEAERCGFGDVEQPAGEEQVLRARRTDEIDEPREVGGREAVAERAGDRDAEARGRRTDAHIAGQRDHAAAAGGDAVDLRDGRHRAGARAGR